MGLSFAGTDPQDSTARGWNLWVALGLFVGWIVLGNVGPMFELAPGVRAWYPPVALLAAALISWGGRALIPIYLAAALSAVATSTPAESLGRVLLVSLALKLVYWGGAHVLRRTGFDSDFPHTGHVAAFAGVFAATAAVAAIIGVMDVLNSGDVSSPDTLRLIRTFWIGDVVAVYALAPALLVLASWVQRRGALPRPRLSRRNILQLASIPISIVCATLLARSLGFFSYALCFLPVGWIALTHGPRYAALANVVFVLGALWSVREVAEVAPRSLEVQAFTALLVLTGLMIGSVADERERAFTLLGQSEERYRSLVELLPDPIVVHEQGRILFANGAAAHTLGATSPEQLTGMSLVDIAAPRSKHVTDERMNVLARGKAVPVVRHTVDKIDGSGTAEIEVVSVPFSYQGRPAALTVARDVTSRVRLEDELRQAQRMEAVGRLAGGVAHDFNNLLTVITSYSELILGTLPPDAPQVSDVREIHHAADRAAALTRQLLSFSRRQVLQPAAIDVSDVVRSSERLLRRLIGPEIEIISRLSPDAGRVLADRGQLEQVIVNLAVNARDAMPEGGTLTIETGRIEAAADPDTVRCSTQAAYFATILVRDTGVGMDEITKQHIFDPFFTTKDVGRGTGLGLATVHGIVAQSGGAITVDTAVGKGTTFRILLPALEQEGVAAAAGIGYA